MNEEEFEELNAVERSIVRHSHAPDIIQKADDQYDRDDLAEVCTVVENTVREECIERGIGKHGGIACLYLVIDRLVEYDSPEEKESDE